jgi:hypothetical protein
MFEMHILSMTALCTDQLLFQVRDGVSLNFPRKDLLKYDYGVDDGLLWQNQSELIFG